MLLLNIRLSVKLCRLVRRPAVNRRWIVRYGNMLICMDYSGAQRKLLACINLWRLNSSDYSGAQRNLKLRKELWPSGCFFRRALCARLSIVTSFWRRGSQLIQTHVFPNEVVSTAGRVALDETHWAGVSARRWLMQPRAGYNNPGDYRSLVPARSTNFPPGPYAWAQ